MPLPALKFVGLVALSGHCETGTSASRTRVLDFDTGLAAAETPKIYVDDSTVESD
jgi:hypothetical protein